jgi:DNA-binding NarL/FixJ family response regulator
MLAGMDSLVGREAELERIDGVLERLHSGPLRCLTVEGEPGIGKTRLLAELRRRSEGQGQLVLQGVASEFETYLPFGVVADAFDAYLASRGDRIAGDWPPQLRAELASMFPSLRHGGEPDPATTGDERYRAHRAMRGLIELLAAERPLVVILDDVHWADGASLELIQALLRRTPDAGGLLTLGFRPGQAPTRLLAALAAPLVERIALGPLTREEAAELLAADPTAPALRRIYEQGGGNPFYLEQLARTGSSAGAMAAAPESGVPPSIAVSVAEELASLPARARLMLESAAIAGDPFEPDIAAEIGRIGEDEALPTLDELLGADLVRPTQVPRRFRFRHPLLRRAVYEGTRGGWRLAAHSRAAAALASRGAAATALAHHVEHAARQGEEPAIALLIEAGEAGATRAPVVAARWFGAVLRLLPAADVTRQVAVRAQLAQVLRSSGELEQCRATLIDAIELIPEAADPMRVELTTRCAAVERWLGRGRDANGRLMWALQQLPAHETLGRAALQIELATDGVFERDFDRAIDMAQTALATARSLGSASHIGAAAAALALAEAGAGRIESARKHRAEAHAVIDQLPDEQLAESIDALYHLGWAENYLEYYDAALAHVNRMIDIVRSGAGARPLVPMMLVKCYPLETLGRLREAGELCDAAVEATQLDGAAHFLPWALFERAWAHYYLGELGAAIGCAEESMRISNRQIGGAGPSAGIGPAWILACALIESDRPEQAIQLLRPLAGEDIEGAMPVERCFFWETLALAESSAGSPERAERYVARAEDDAATIDLVIPLGVARRARAELTLAAGDASRAAELAAESAAAFASIGARIEVAFSRVVQGRALARAGDRRDAISVLQRAEAELDACASARERDAARRELRKLGARAEVRGPAAGADSGIQALTKREREIADLVTGRRTNREIASELFLSEKTIESHLRNIFVKLGASSRTEVARAIEKTGRQPG